MQLFSQLFIALERNHNELKEYCSSVANSVLPLSEKNDILFVAKTSRFDMAYDKVLNVLKVQRRKYISEYIAPGNQSWEIIE